MLVLSRNLDESLIIGTDVKITVTKVRGDKVWLGITAPKHVRVTREEVYEAMLDAGQLDVAGEEPRLIESRPCEPPPSS